MLQNKKAKELSLNGIIVVTLTLIGTVILVIMLIKPDLLKPQFNPEKDVCLEGDYYLFIQHKNFTSISKIEDACSIQLNKQYRMNTTSNDIKIVKFDEKTYDCQLIHNGSNVIGYWFNRNCIEWRSKTREETFMDIFQDCDYYGRTSDSVLFCLNDKEVPKLTQAD